MPVTAISFANSSGPCPAPCFLDQERPRSLHALDDRDAFGGSPYAVRASSSGFARPALGRHSIRSGPCRFIHPTTERSSSANHDQHKIHGVDLEPNHKLWHLRISSSIDSRTPAVPLSGRHAKTDRRRVHLPRLSFCMALIATIDSKNRSPRRILSLQVYGSSSFGIQPESAFRLADRLPHILSSGLLR